LAIRDLDDGAGVIAQGLHAPIAVVPAGRDLRPRVRAALEGHPDVFVVDMATVAARLGEDRSGLEAWRGQDMEHHEECLAQLRQKRQDAGEKVATASAAVESALGSLETIDRAERELGEALVQRDRATASESAEARHLAEVLERRERLAQQRREAVEVITGIEAGGPVRRSPDLRRQVSDMESGLARAEAEQTRAERAAEASLHQAREARIIAATEVERADRILRSDLPGLPEVSAEGWPPGPPLPVLISERRERIASLLAERYATVAAARTAFAACATELRRAEQDLERFHQGLLPQGAASILEAVLRDVLPDTGPETVSDTGSAQRDRIVVCDDPFPGIDASVVTPILERLAQSARIQVIYLTDDARTVAWAEELPSAMGGVSSLGTVSDSAAITRLPPAGLDPASAPASLPAPVPVPAEIPSGLGHRLRSTPANEELPRVSTHP